MSRPSQSWAVACRRNTLRFPREEIGEAWAQLHARPRIPRPVYVVAGGTHMRVTMTPSKSSPCELAGVFDGGLPLDEFRAEVEHTAEELAETMNLELIA